MAHNFKDPTMNQSALLFRLKSKLAPSLHDEEPAHAFLALIELRLY